MPRVLREAEKQRIAKVEDYPSETHAFVLELMCAYGFCFAVEEDGEPGDSEKRFRYFFPELFPAPEPDMSEQWEEAPVRLRYVYDVLPPGLLPRFVVRMHGLADGAPNWRHGVVLRHGEASALIREEPDRSELELSVLGGDHDTRRVLVTMVRRELEALHREMRARPIEELELTGAAGSWIGVNALREVRHPEGKPQKLLVRPEGTREVDVAFELEKVPELDVALELDKLEPAESRAIERDPAAAPALVRVFVSYAHKDERQLQRLDLILDVLEYQHGLVPWRDKRLIAGDEWEDEIRQRLEDMDIFLFIASQRSLVSPYIRDNELKRARERREAGEVEIVTVKLEPCAADEDPILGKLQRLAPTYGSIAETSPRSLAWEQVRKDLLPVIERVREKKKAAKRRGA
jgi:internalin A